MIASLPNAKGRPPVSFKHRYSPTLDWFTIKCNRQMGRAPSQLQVSIFCCSLITSLSNAINRKGGGGPQSALSINILSPFESLATKRNCQKGEGLLSVSSIDILHSFVIASLPSTLFRWGGPPPPPPVSFKHRYSPPLRYVHDCQKGELELLATTSLILFVFGHHDAFLASFVVM